MTVIRKRDQFPIGMRVLAVDDDPTCLKVLESLLHRCQYHVTTTNQAIKALEMLREDKKQFDLVISDVHMPDMDGFKLLEHVGLEMDLPVIMLSANGETQAVMKGITHGACDYLIKPVRYEELKNIWQHVIRKKKHDPNDQNNFDSGDDSDRNQLANPERPQGSFANSKINRKRKDQIEEYEDDGESTLHENEDSSSQKKPRVVWSVELHRKFVGAVNQLGLDKAVPKRILDLMNVEGITRENVASHLQKYRLYLKRLSAVANQQANMVAALRGSRDTSYMPIGSLDPYPNYNTIIGSKPLQSNGSIPKLNTFNGFGFHGFMPPTTRGPVNDITKIQGMQESSRSLLGGLTPKNHIRMPLPLNSDPFEVNIGNSLNFVDVNRCNDTWQNAAASSNLYNSNTNIAPVNNLKWEQPVQGQFCNSSGTYDSSSSPLVSNAHIGDVSRKMDLPIIGQSSYSSPLSIHDYKPEQLSYKDDQLFVDTKLSNGFVSSNFGLDDLVTRTMVKPECEDFSFIEDDVGCSDLYSLGACM